MISSVEILNFKDDYVNCFFLFIYRMFLVGFLSMFIIVILLKGSCLGI